MAGRGWTRKRQSGSVHGTRMVTAFDHSGLRSPHMHISALCYALVTHKFETGGVCRLQVHRTSALVKVAAVSLPKILCILCGNLRTCYSSVPTLALQQTRLRRKWQHLGTKLPRPGQINPKRLQVAPASRAGATDVYVFLFALVGVTWCTNSVICPGWGNLVPLWCGCHGWGK